LENIARYPSQQRKEGWKEGKKETRFAFPAMVIIGCMILDELTSPNLTFLVCKMAWLHYRACVRIRT
jgi:hypothetical protein